MRSFIVFCDACVLYPAPIRDLLMELSLNELLQLKWSKRVLDEWIENLLKNRPDLTRDRLENTIALMKKAVPDCLIEDYESIEKDLNLPDANDDHVLAAAIASKANYIITANLKDFPQEYVSQFKIKVCHPDELFILIIKKNAMKFISVIKACQRKLKKPAKTMGEYLLNLDMNCNLSKTVTYLEKHKNLLKD